MEDEELSHGNVSLLRHPTISTTLSLPLARYTSRLISGDHHQISSDGVGENCSYSKPIVVLDLIWNLAFVDVSVVVLLSTFRERPSTPLRVWLSGYALQCLLHLAFVFLEYRHRNQNADDDDDDDYGIEDQLPASSHTHTQNNNSIAKRLESVNTIISSIWWVLGFYWLVLGGQVLLQDSPRLYWLTVVFLAFDVFYIVFCIGTACIVFIALLFCIPVVAIAYAVRTKEGASEDEIRALPKYKYCHESSWPNVLGARSELDNSKFANELARPPDDSECCICLSHYVNGTELYILPCNHHFHCGCISRWLRMNATCPLCKFDILRGDDTRV